MHINYYLPWELKYYQKFEMILMQNTCFFFFPCAQQVLFCVAQASCLQTVSLLPVPCLLIMKDMVRRLQELRHTEQVQRAYALNCGEGATVSYEIQIRVLREFGLADAAAELLQVGSSPPLLRTGNLVLRVSAVINNENVVVFFWIS